MPVDPTQSIPQKLFASLWEMWSSIIWLPSPKSDWESSTPLGYRSQALSSHKGARDGAEHVGRRLSLPPHHRPSANGTLPRPISMVAQSSLVLWDLREARIGLDTWLLCCIRARRHSLESLTTSEHKSVIQISHLYRPAESARGSHCARYMTWVER